MGNSSPETALIAKANADGARHANDFAAGVHRLEPADGFGDRDAGDRGIAQADHLAEFAFGDEFDGGCAEAGSQNAVERGRRAAALDVSEHADAHFLVSGQGDGVTDGVGHRTAAGELLQFAGEADAFGNDDDGEVLVLGFAFGDVGAQALERKRGFRE